MTSIIDAINKSELGKKSHYKNTYDASLLFPVARLPKRKEIGVPQSLPFYGVDYWTAYEISWLNQKGKPEVAIAEIAVPCTSPNIIESKSMKLYFNSFNNTHFSNQEDVLQTLQRDLSLVAGVDISVQLFSLEKYNECQIKKFPGKCLDTLDIATQCYEVNPDFLLVGNEITEESLNSALLKSNCLVTGQPDWADIYIHYRGKTIDHAGLLKYIISFRNVNEFHEQCVERIFMDIFKRCQPQELTVYARYTRRGGLDINPYRSTNSNFSSKEFMRLVRQ